MNPESEQPLDQPVAYDAEGRPLYAHPAPKAEANAPQSHVTATGQTAEGEDYDPQWRVQQSNEPTVVHAIRPTSPLTLSDDVKNRHEESKQKFPHLNLSEGECVLLNVRRHHIGLLGPIAGAVVALLFLAGVLIVYPADAESSGLPSYGIATIVAVVLMALVGLGTLISVWVFLQNQLYLTNESIIQEIQTSLFSRREQIVSLGSIEDASFQQNGIFQTIFNYGMIRLSTEGDETTYRFSYVADPRTQVNQINDAIESFKNGRPVEMPPDAN